MIKVNCNLCGSDNYSVFYPSTIRNSQPRVEDYISTNNQYGIYNTIVVCNCCGLKYVNPRDEGIKDLYKSVVDNAYLESWNERAYTFTKHMKVLSKYYKEGKSLLDVGCYAGIFLSEAKKAGYAAAGLDPSLWAVVFAREKTCADVRQGGWDEVFFPEESFDIVTMWDVIEHLEDPSACLNQAYRWLKKNGIIALTTHDIASPFARFMGKRYLWLMRFHLYHFEPKTLSAMLFKNNFQPIATEYYSKKVSLQYFVERVGVRIDWKIFKKIPVAINTGDFFIIIARKQQKD